MKQFEPGFDQLFEQYEMDSPAKDGAADLEQSYLRVLEKAGMPVHRTCFGRRTRMLLVAAAVAVAGLCLAAAAYSASDAFRGVLELRQGLDASGAGREELFGRIGTLTSDRAEDAGVEVTLRAAVCDDRQLRILVDIEDPSGGLPTPTGEDGEVTMGDLMFRDFQLDKQGDDYGGYSARYHLLSLTDKRAAVLLEYNVAESQVRGETFILTLQDIMQWGYRDGTALDMGPDDLYHMVDKILAAGFPLDEEFTQMDSLLYGYRGLEFPIGTGGEITVTNAVIYEETLYLAGRGNPSDLDRMLENVILKNAATGEELEYNGGSRGGEGEEEIMSWWSMEFDGITSPEDLRGFVWYYGAGHGAHPVIEGRWELTVHADVEDTAIIMEPDLDVVWDGHAMKVKVLEVSPLGMYLTMETSPDTAQAMFDVDEGAVFSSWRAGTYPLTLNMKDGTALEVDSPGTGGTDNMWQETREFYMQYSFDAVIDPGEVVTIDLGGKTIRVHD